ncbi:magnesium-chelatase subunit ChlI, chloroplastic-like isoform X2 [Phoenix dactylifera]|uniref:Magnesium-chelatase subunit ChlI, chloroplastic-like isoform X2 n=1 Tax=Phoenix dactylifera TaxID=42345 RepID=A0A8B9AQE6_PHODC|nr:magnesium-chelatase subunit ChlI, chloroplastic-like isoform X2 [Phoenix dactylifera]
MKPNPNAYAPPYVRFGSNSPKPKPKPSQNPAFSILPSPPQSNALPSPPLPSPRAEAGTRRSAADYPSIPRHISSPSSHGGANRTLLHLLLIRHRHCFPSPHLSPLPHFPAPIQHRRSFHGKIGTGFRRGARRSIISIVAVPDISSTEAAKKLAAKESQPPVYPFSAIVGQDEMKLCLLLNVIGPKNGGVMIMGDRGTGKSATIRSLVDLLPEIRVVVGHPFNSDPEDPESMGMEVRECVMKLMVGFL